MDDGMSFCGRGTMVDYQPSLPPRSAHPEKNQTKEHSVILSRAAPRSAYMHRGPARDNPYAAGRFRIKQYRKHVTTVRYIFESFSIKTIASSYLPVFRKKYKRHIYSFPNSGFLFFCHVRFPMFSCISISVNGNWSFYKNVKPLRKT